MAESDGASKSITRVINTQLITGVLFSLIILGLTWTKVYQDQEASTFDFRFRLRNNLFGAPVQSPDITTVDIDDLALQKHGFPFTRDKHADLLTVLDRYKARMIGFDIFFYEPSAHHLSPADVESLDRDPLTKDDVLGLIKDHDGEFVEAARKSNIVYLPQTFEVSEMGPEYAAENLRKRSPEKEAALELLRPSFTELQAEMAPHLFPTTDMEIPLLSFIEAVKGVGFALPQPDNDGIVRRYRLALAYDGRVFYSLAMFMACDYLQVPLEKVIFVPGSQVIFPQARFPDGTVTDVVVPVSDKMELLVNWAGSYHDTYRHLPYDLIIDFAGGEPRNQAWKWAKKVAVEDPELLGNDEAYLTHAVDTGLPAELLMEMKYLLTDCLDMERVLSDDLELETESYVASLGVPEEEIPAVVKILGPYFTRIRNNLEILEVLSEDPELSLGDVAKRMGVTRLEEIKLGVGIIRDLMRRGVVQPEDHPLLFFDLIKSAGLHGKNSMDRIVTKDDLENTVFFYGLTATGTHDLNPTPFGAREAMLGAHVNVFNTIITQNFLRRVPWWGNALIVLSLGFLIGLIVPRFRALPGAAIVGVFFLFYMVGAFLLFAKGGVWVDYLGPLGTLVIGYLSITIYNYIQKEKERDFVQGAFGHYLDPQVVDDLVNNPEALGQLGGDQRIMTAFFSDVASFSTISENLTPSELVELLNEYLTEMCDIVAEQGGTIDKFEGDAIIAFWGAPIKTEDHGLRAAKAAVEMQKNLKSLRKKWEEEGKMEDLRQMWSDQGRGEFFRVRMGINTGEMVVGNLGSKTRVDYTIMGDAVNLAARLEGAGKAYGVTSMISETTMSAAGEAFEFRELDSIRVVGKDEPVKVYELLGARGDVTVELHEVAELYAQGIGIYKQRKWDEAITMFEAGLKVNPDDGPCNVFVERCRKFKTSPPPEEWDAVHDLDEK